MFISIKCSFCDQPFDFDSSSGILLADCPHCGKQNTIAAPAGETKGLNVLHDTPTLAAGKTCPSCQAQVARPDVLCIHCGYNFVTRKKVGGNNWFAANQTLVFLAGGGLVVLALAATYALWPSPEAPLNPFPPSAEPVAVQSAPTPPPAAPAETNAPAVTNAPAEPVTPPPPPGPTPEELAAKQAEADRVAFEAKKVQAEQTLRQQLDAREPLYKLGDTVEIRRKNGVFHKGTLRRFAGTGTDRVAVIATVTGEISVPLVALDSTPRRRMDPGYREAFIQHVLSTKLPATPVEQPAE